MDSFELRPDNDPKRPAVRSMQARFQHTRWRVERSKIVKRRDSGRKFPPHSTFIHLYFALEESLRGMPDPMLAPFLGRSDPKIVATYMHEQHLAYKKRSELNRTIEENLKKMGAQPESEQ